MNNVNHRLHRRGKGKNTRVRMAHKDREDGGGILMKFIKGYNVVRLEKLDRGYRVVQSNPMNIVQWGYKRKSDALKMYNKRVNLIKKALVKV
jgi:hypothetical protein